MDALANGRRLRLAATVFGAGTFFCWVYYTYFTSALSPFGMYTTEQAQYCWTISNPSLSITYFAWIILYAAQPDFAQRTGIHKAISVLWALGQVLMVIGANTGTRVLMTVGALGVGIGGTAVSIMWCRILAGEDGSEVKIIFSYFMVLAVTAGVQLLPQTGQAVVAALLPVLSLGCLAFVLHGCAECPAPDHRTSVNKKAIGGSIWPLVLVVAIIWMCHTFLEGHTTSALGASTPSYFIVFVFGSVITIVVSAVNLWFGKGPWFTSLYIFSVPFMVVSLFMAAAMPGSGFVPYLFEFAAVLMTTIFVWTVSVDLARRGVFPPVLSVSLFRGTYYIGQTGLLAFFQTASAGISFEMQCFLAACILALVTMASLCSKAEYASVPAHAGGSEGRGNETTGSGDGSAEGVPVAEKDPVAAIAEDYAMTEREREILELLVQGRSVTYIVEALYISRNTVNSHVKHIYQKLGVHSKQQMLDMVVGKPVLEGRNAGPAAEPEE